VKRERGIADRRSLFHSPGLALHRFPALTPPGAHPVFPAARSTGPAALRGAMSSALECIFGFHIIAGRIDGLQLMRMSLRGTVEATW
jgi:hypothetical protein